MSLYNIIQKDACLCSAIIIELKLVHLIQFACMSFFGCVCAGTVEWLLKVRSHMKDLPINKVDNTGKKIICNLHFLACILSDTHNNSEFLKLSSSEKLFVH